MDHDSAVVQISSVEWATRLRESARDLQATIRRGRATINRTIGAMRAASRITRGNQLLRGDEVRRTGETLSVIAAKDAGNHTLEDVRRAS